MAGRMAVLTSVGEMRRWSRARRARGLRVGFVPTMGNLHPGHLRLVERARASDDRVVASIFVNPTQFGPGEDYRAYPRTPARDRRLLALAGCDAVFLPSASQMYPEGFQTQIRVSQLSRPLCGRFRKGHFEGVATVVAKLLAAVEPDRLYLGQKDYQQGLVIRRMVADLDLPVRVETVPTVRESDGLAMSSRNRYLDAAHRARAAGIYAALAEGARRVQAGERSAARVRRAVREALRGVGRVQYVEVVSAEDLSARARIRGRTLLAAAVFVGRARLIDNVVVKP